MAEKYFIYCRTSSDREDKQVLGIPSQKKELLEYAHLYGLKVVDVYCEKQTAYKTGRPLFNEMLARIEKGEADSILTWHLSRLARNSSCGGRLIYMMDESKIKEIRTKEKIYTGTTSDKFMMQIEFAMTKKSSDDTSDFVKRDCKSKLAKGEYPGVCPLGYLNLSKEGVIAGKMFNSQKQLYFEQLKLNRPLKRVEIDPVDGELVRRLFEEFAKGNHSLRSIIKLSDEISLRARRSHTKLSKVSIHRILTNPFYYGVIRYNGQLYASDVQHDALISKELFDKVQLVLKNKQKSKRQHNNFAYTGFIKCACGSAITAIQKKGHIYYYCCQSKGECQVKKYVREEELERQLKNKLKSLYIPNSFVEWAKKQIRFVYEQESKQQDTIRKKLQIEHTTCKTKFKNLLNMKISPENTSGELLSDVEYLEQKKLLQDELFNLEAKLKDQSNHEDSWINRVEQFFDFVSALGERFNNGDANTKRSILLSIGSKFILELGELSLQINKPFTFIQNLPDMKKIPLEPAETQSMTGKNPSCEEIMTQWRDRRDLNPRPPA